MRVKSDLLSFLKGKYETKYSEAVLKKIKLFVKKVQASNLEWGIFKVVLRFILEVQKLIYT